MLSPPTFAIRPADFSRTCQEEISNLWHSSLSSFLQIDSHSDPEHCEKSNDSCLTLYLSKMLDSERILLLNPIDCRASPSYLKRPFLFACLWRDFWPPYSSIVFAEIFALGAIAFASRSRFARGYLGDHS